MIHTRQTQLKNIRRLIQVAEKFRDGEGKLDMLSWSSSGDAEAPSLRKVLNGACNTTVCLAGLAGLYPHFRKQGLSTDFFNCIVGNDRYVGELFSHSHNSAGLAGLFGFSYAQHAEIFHGDNVYTATGRISKKQTINRIIASLKRIARENSGVTI